MADIDVIMQAIGFDKMRADFEQMHARFVQLGNSAQNLGGMFQNASKSIERFASSIGAVEGPAGTVFSVINTGTSIIGTLIEVVSKATVAVAGLGAALGAGTVGFLVKWTQAVSKAQEEQLVWERSFIGVARSAQAMRDIDKTATEYAIKYGFAVERIQKVMKDMASIPGVGEAIKSGDVAAAQRYLDILNRISVMKPGVEIEEVAGALRMAAIGFERPLRRLIGVRMERLGAETGISPAEMKESPERLMHALEAFTKTRVSPENLEASAKMIGRMIQSIRSAWGEWVEEIGRAGVYEKVVRGLQRIRDAIVNLLTSEAIKTWTDRMAGILNAFISTIESVLTKGIDWSKVVDFESFYEAFKKVISNIGEVLKEVWEVVRGPFYKGLLGLVEFSAEVLVDAVKNIFIPVGVSIVRGILSGVDKAFKEGVVAQALDYLAKIGVMGPQGRAVSFLMHRATRWAVGEEEGEAAGVAGVREPKKRGLALFEEAMGDFAKAVDQLAKKYFPDVSKAAGGAADSMKKAGEAAQRTAEQMLSEVDKWASMMRTIVTAKTPLERYEEEDRKLAEMREMREKWETGKIKEEEWRAFRGKAFAEEERGWRVARFQMEYESKLLEFLRRQDVTEQMRAGIYEKLFGVAIERGDLGRASDYMQKSLDAMVKAQDLANGNILRGLDYQKEIADNTRAMAQKMDALKEGRKEITQVPTRGEKPAPQSSMYFERDEFGNIKLPDDWRYEVGRNLYTNL